MSDLRLLRRVALGMGLAVCAASLSACHFHRVRTNEWVRDLDGSRIEIGRSTWQDVLNEFGPPSPGTSERIGREAASLSYFSYVSTDRTTTTFLFPPTYVILPWVWVDEQDTHRMTVEFDSDGLVSDLYVVREDYVWRPTNDETDRAQRQVTFPAGRP